MSVSITMIPVALALRVVMGKEKFNTWMKSSQRTQVSDFKSRRELTSSLQLASYDAVPYGASIKTHFKRKGFFFWELREGKWTAVFSEYDDMTEIRKFVDKLNESVGRNVFAEEEVEQITKDHQTWPALFPTNFTNMQLLQDALEENSIPTGLNADGMLVSCLQTAELHFIQHQPDGLIDVEIKGHTEMGSIFNQLSILDEDYRKLIQQEAYTNVLENAEEKGFVIEGEELLADDSILLTLRVGG